MKIAAARRIQREISKRKHIAVGEKRARLLRFVGLASASRANGYRTATLLLERGRRARSAACRRHCFLTGRGSSVYRFFRLTRHAVRERFHRGELFGVRKASWLRVGLNAVTLRRGVPDSTAAVPFGVEDLPLMTRLHILRTTPSALLVRVLS
jgi:ribosomal protein S14